MSMLYLDHDSNFKKAFLNIVCIIFSIGIDECGPGIFRNDIIRMTLADVFTHSDSNNKHLSMEEECNSLFLTPIIIHRAE